MSIMALIAVMGMAYVYANGSLESMVVQQLVVW